MAEEVGLLDGVSPEIQRVGVVLEADAQCVGRAPAREAVIRTDTRHWEDATRRVLGMPQMNRSAPAEREFDLGMQCLTGEVLKISAHDWTLGKLTRDRAVVGTILAGRAYFEETNSCRCRQRCGMMLRTRRKVTAESEWGGQPALPWPDYRPKVSRE